MKLFFEWIWWGFSNLLNILFIWPFEWCMKQFLNQPKNVIRGYYITILLLLIPGIFIDIIFFNILTIIFGIIMFLSIILGFISTEDEIIVKYSTNKLRVLKAKKRIKDDWNW